MGSLYLGIRYTRVVGIQYISFSYALLIVLEYTT